MKKELIICLVIVTSIVFGDIFLQKYTNNALDNINEKLIVLKDEIKQSDDIDMSKINEIDEEWEKNFEIFTCYLEHDELEKIKTQLVIISSGMEMNDRDYAYEEIDRAIFIIDHIKSKQMLKLDNIL